MAAVPVSSTQPTHHIGQGVDEVTATVEVRRGLGRGPEADTSQEESLMD